MTMSVVKKSRLEFYHPNLKHLRKICQTDQFARSKECRDFELVRQTIPFPALLEFAGFPKLRNQQCFAHKGSTGTSLSFFQHHQTGQWMFCCNNAECGVLGDQTEFWFQVVQRARRQPADWSLPKAAGDLLARVDRGEIYLQSREFDDESSTRGHAARERDDYFAQLGQLVRKNQGGQIGGRLSLPKAIKLRAEEAIRGLFPENRYLMLTAKRDYHPIKLRDDWLAGSVAGFSFVSSNYCSRADVDGTSYAAFEGIKRRWLVMESDRGSLEEQFWLHEQLRPSCLCWSGGKSLHGWYLVQGWSLQRCFELFAQAIRLGVNDPRGWLICQQVRLPAGFNWQSREKQKILLWDL
jgi:hypothetical protein